MGVDSVNTSLLERAGHGDEVAWTRLVQLFTPLIAHWCRSRGVRSEDLPDVCQEVLSAAFCSLERYDLERGGSAFLPWVRGITRFKIMEHFRKRAQQPSAHGGSEHVQLLQEIHAPAEASPEVEQEDRQILLRQALHLLQSQFQSRTWEAFWETVVEDRPTAQVAESLGMTALAVRQARWRVLQRLREELGDVLGSLVPDTLSKP
jgi:RNA polymerase sigma-70 factor (ECF subfamily)